MATMARTNNTLTAIPGIRVGHATNLDAITGCTVILCPDGTVGGVDSRGGAPGTRETDLLRPMHLVNNVNAVILSGGSAYGLASADGVMRYCEENQIGYRSGTGFLVPIVAGAILMDLPIGDGTVRPDAIMGYAAARAASTEPVQQGSVGAGTGCRIGAFRGNEFASKGGIGSASVDLGNGLVVAAIIAVNSVGDVIDVDGTILAGLRETPDGDTFVGMMNAMRGFATAPPPDAASDGNTVIGVVATNAKLNKEEVNKIAQMAHDGIARAINPAHTMFDGDTMFALATGEIAANVSAVGAFAAEVTATAIHNAVRHATSLAGVRAIHE